MEAKFPQNCPIVVADVGFESVVCIHLLKHPVKKVCFNCIAAYDKRIQLEAERNRARLHNERQKITDSMQYKLNDE